MIKTFNKCLKYVKATTLIELLITMSLLSIIIFMVFNILTVIINMNSRISTTLNLRDDINFGLDYLDYLLTNADPQTIECQISSNRLLSWQDILHSKSYTLKKDTGILFIEARDNIDPSNTQQIFLLGYATLLESNHLSCSNLYYDPIQSRYFKTVSILLNVKANSLSQKNAKEDISVTKFRSILVKN